MRKSPSKRIEQYRVTTGPLASTARSGANGAFFLPGPSGATLTVVASDGSGWTEDGLPGPPFEHVSVSCQARCPTWPEMAFVKSIFWSDEELVLQFHPPKSEYINDHEFCLHLWRPIGVDIPLPPRICV
jgi:hypothetical protein